MFRIAGLAERRIDVLTIGSLVMEQVALIEQWPELGGQDVVKVRDMVFTAGGCAMNVAAFIGRFGGFPAIVSAIGTGKYSEEIWEELDRSRVDTQFLRVYKGREGSLIFIMSNPEGDWAVLDYMDPLLKIQEEDIPSVNKLKQAKAIHIDGFSFVSAGCESAIRLALQRGREAGCIISVDASVPAAKQHLDFLRWLIRKADIAYMNKFEGQRITGADATEEVVARLQSFGPRLSFLKLGSGGSFVITPESCEELPAFEVDVVDTVAAGDAYVATSLLMLIRGMTPKEAGLRGSAAGALACLGAGSLSSRFTLDNVEDMVRQGHPLAT